jgi:trehalose 6-phosphate synthase
VGTGIGTAIEEKIVTALDETSHELDVEDVPASEPDLSTMLGSATLITVANRLPCAWPPTDAHLVPTPGGLASTVLPVARRSAATWIGTAPEGDDLAPRTIDGIRLVPVSLTAEQEEGYYAGFSNAAIWPLYHDALRPSRFRRTLWDHYVSVNRQVAAATVAEIAPDDVVWVHDYHLQLVPMFVRAARPDTRIGFFLHIPFPDPALFRRLPWRSDVLRGLLGADVLGFQDGTSARNFQRCCQELGLGTVDGEAVRHAHGESVVGVFPVATDGIVLDEMSRWPGADLGATALRQQCGNPDVLLLGVDRLDYTKGIDVRLKAYELLLRSGRFQADRTVFLQVAPPSRTDVREYQAEQARVERAVARINGRYGSPGHQPILYLNQSMSTEELVAAYRAADVMVVTPLRDGMNLVAKEYIAAQHDHRGALVLSEFAGAAAQLDLAHIVNPYDLPSVAAGIFAAATADPLEAADRMRRMRETVMAESPEEWALAIVKRLIDQRGPGREDA